MDKAQLENSDTKQTEMLESGKVLSDFMDVVFDIVARCGGLTVKVIQIILATAFGPLIMVADFFAYDERAICLDIYFNNIDPNEISSINDFEKYGVSDVILYPDGYALLTGTPMSGLHFNGKGGLTGYTINGLKSGKLKPFAATYLPTLLCASTIRGAVLTILGQLSAPIIGFQSGKQNLPVDSIHGFNPKRASGKLATLTCAPMFGLGKLCGAAARGISHLTAKPR